MSDECKYGRKDDGSCRRSPRPGFSWASPRGTRIVVAQKGNLSAVSYKGKPGAELLTEDDIAFEIRRDATNLSFRRRESATVKKAAVVKARDEDIRGFYNRMTPAQAGRARKTLHKTQRFSGVLSTRKAFIEKAVKNGYRAEGARLVGPSRDFYDQKDITKTALDYARYLGSLEGA